MVEQQPQDEPNPLMRKKKTPEELAAEAEQEDLDDFTSKYFIMFCSSKWKSGSLEAIGSIINHRHMQ